MKVSAVLALVAASVVSAQLSDIPSCALTCAVSSIGSSGCQETDIKCICMATAFINALTPCVQGACSAADLAKTIQAAEGLCSGVGVTLSIPTAGATSMAASSSSSMASSTSMASSESSTMMTTTVATTTAVVTSTSSVAVVVSTTAVSNATTTAASNTTMLSTSALPTASPSGNAADRVAVGGFAAFLALAAALL